MNPFHLVFFSCLLPSLGALLDIPVFHLPVFLAFSVLIVRVLLSKREMSFREIKENPLVPLVGLTMLGILLFQIRSGRGFVVLNGGFYCIFLSYVFYKLFGHFQGMTWERVVEGVCFIYKFLLVCMLFELLIILFNGQELLKTIFFSSKTTSYRGSLAFDIPNLFGLLEGKGGLNTILLGAQIAVMISVFSFIWFFMIQKIPLVNKTRSKLWIYVSLFCLLFTINGTGFALLFAAILIYGFFIHRKRWGLMLVGGFILMGFIYFLYTHNLLPERFSPSESFVLDSEKLERHPELAFIVGDITMLEYYMYVFVIIPFTVFAQITFEDLLFGIGGDAFLTRYGFFGSDFGFGVDVMLKPGLLWSVLIVSVICFICFRNMKIPEKTKGADGYEWFLIRALNALIALLWLLSTFHYNQAFGHSGAGNVLLAMHLSLCLYANDQCKLIKQSQPLNRPSIREL